MKAVAAIAFLFMVAMLPASAEQACPKYRDNCVSLDTFKCNEITQNTKNVFRICHDAATRYMIIWLGKNRVPYHYCNIPAEVVERLLNADSIDEFYMKVIWSKKGEVRFDCKQHPVPEY
jgi:KTSC domain